MTTQSDQRVLILAPVGRDGELAARVLADAGIAAAQCGSLVELCAEMREGAAALLLTEEVLVMPGATAVRREIEAQPAWSDLPILVFGSSPATLGNRANLTLLDRPVRIRTLLSAVRSALRARRRQYEARGALEAVEQSVRDRDQFLAMLGHELRNPLAAILTASELLDRQAKDSFLPLRAVIGRQVRHLGRLVDDLLDVSRITSGKITLDHAAVDLNELADRTARAYEADARARGLTLIVRTQLSPLTVTGDAVRLEQVAGNLLGNAIKYTPPPGRIEVETAVEAGQAVLRVRDTGVGIEKEMLPRVFDLFVQAPGTLDRAQGGMGIGLTLVQRLVALHGGGVEAKSDGAGLGSTFEVRLPLSVDTCDARKIAAIPLAVARRVLLAEDNADSREVLQLALEQLGHTVDTCVDGAAAVQRALAEPPEVMIVDLGLPLADGYEVARNVRAALGAGVRLIALTGYGQPDDRARALECGFDVFLTKPVEMHEIASALA